MQPLFDQHEALTHIQSAKTVAMSLEPVGQLLLDISEVDATKNNTLGVSLRCHWHIRSCNESSTCLMSLKSSAVTRAAPVELSSEPGGAEAGCAAPAPPPAPVTPQTRTQT